MLSSFRVFVISLLLFVPAATPAVDAPRVVLRQAAGDGTLAPRFYHVDPNSPPAPTAWFPTQNDVFETVPVRRAPDPRQAVNPGGPTVVFRDRFGWWFTPERPVIVYRFAEVPPVLRGALSAATRAMVVKELADKPYDKTRVKKKEEHIRLPAPTLRHPKRTKKHRILSTREEYQIQARLDGQPAVEITHMPYLKRHDQPEHGILMFVVRAELPVAGRVRYRVPDVLSVSTGYRAQVALDVVVEVRARRDADAVHLDAPEVLRIDARIENLNLSKDLLDAARRPIRDLLNDELRRKHDRIRQQANKAIHKAIDDQTFRSPLLRYLLPL
ncbi:MAG: hypothetical protein JW719_12005 [Pirellulales bacterium]|nr:hypothetical protein [Pirellulales bacterium]